MTHWSYILKAIRPHRKRLALALAATLGIMLVDLGSPLVVAFLIDTVVSQGRYDLLAPLMVAFAALPFAAAGCHFLSNYSIALLSQRLLLDIRLDLYRRVQRLSCRFLQDTPTGKVMERLRGDVRQLQMLLSNQTPQLAVQVVTGLIMIAIMLTLSVRLTMLVLASITLYVANYKWFVRRIRAVRRRQRSKMDRIAALAQERLAGTVMVKTFGGERRESRAFGRQNFTAERVLHRYRLLCMWYGLVSGLITWGTYVLVILYGAVLAIHGQITYGAVTAMTAFAFRLLYPASMLAQLSNQIQQAKISLDRIFQLMEAEPDAIGQKGLVLPKLRGDISFEGVCFQYEPDKPVLRDFSLHVKEGQTVAFVGQTGCGKSTIINLLYRYYDIDSGRLRVDGCDIQSLDTRWYRHQLALVPQEPVVFDTTIAENIAYGRRGATPQQIAHAADMAELGKLIEDLPRGQDTLLGERGATLSVGEKQRLCIARAILADPAILIFDEATSSLDTHSEAMIQLAMRRVMAHRTCLVVAHRLSTIIHADLIVVLDAGRVVEIGSHAKLMAIPGGRYRHLFLTQSAATPRRGAV